ncbi:hypothetical protein LTR08_006399 [Meristemomyces frigidus]|nr:hypothetical protein LTR08_006399 [Meristemomyces frigidus]
MPHLGRPFNARAALHALFDDPLPARAASPAQRRAFHEYFVTHLPSSSLAPDKQPAPAAPRPSPSSTSTSTSASARSAAPAPASRDTTIVRIPIRSAKHHFGAGVSRGERPSNEDTYQAGTIEMPAFATPQPVSLHASPPSGASASAGVKSEVGDPQVFYFGVFDGHGGNECSEFLRDRLHGYVEEAALLFGLQSSLHGSEGSGDSEGGIMGAQDPEDLQKSLVSSWRETVGGYFKRFRPEYFPAVVPQPDGAEPTTAVDHSSVETVLTYAFLKADLDFTAAQASKHSSTAAHAPARASTDDPVLSDRPLNDNDLLFHPDRPASQNLRHKPTPIPARPSSTPDLKAPIGGPTRFKGGSTASALLISTPTPTPFWHPASPATLLVAHVGDTRILLCRTSDGLAQPLTTNHHPDSPVEASRLSRYASAFTTDSFGESRMGGLANTRAFGDIGSKRLGVSAEPQLSRLDLRPSEFSFAVLVSDGVSGTLSDQEIVDVVKEAATPERAAQALVGFAVEVAESADNATGLVVRLGGWERRAEGGRGGGGTREGREWRRREAADPRARRQ